MVLLLPPFTFVRRGRKFPTAPKKRVMDNNTPSNRSIEIQKISESPRPAHRRPPRARLLLSQCVVAHLAPGFSSPSASLPTSRPRSLRCSPGAQLLRPGSPAHRRPGSRPHRRPDSWSPPAPGPHLAGRRPPAPAHLASTASLLPRVVGKVQLALSQGSQGRRPGEVELGSRHNSSPNTSLLLAQDLRIPQPPGSVILVGFSPKAGPAPRPAPLMVQLLTNNISRSSTARKKQILNINSSSSLAQFQAW